MAENKQLAIQEKWQSAWEQNKVFESENDGREKFFATFPYPYINGFPHVGHLFSLMRVEAFSRFQRLKGKNVLFAQGWHATGSPIVQAAKRVKEKEPKQLKILNDLGIPKEKIDTFDNPENWIPYFAPEWKKDFKSIGLSVDWRREFFTTSLNPRYDKFIRWQFEKLKEKNLVIKGKFPVVWDPKENIPVGDHDRVEGEGETPQEFVLLKFRFGNDFIIAATLRPETVFGQTNLWVGPEIVYKRAKVDDEFWIMSVECCNKLKEQEYSVEIVGDVSGKSLLGKFAVAPVIEKEIPILPASFCSPDKGSGIVTSVPSDAPDDYMGLVDLKNNPLELEKYGIKKEVIDKINPVPIIRSSDLGDLAAVAICSDMGIKNSKERTKLEEAKKIVYKKGFYEGTMLESSGLYAGMAVKDAKEKIKKDLLKQKKAGLLYELTGKVVSRSLTPCIVKIVSDQWFIDYNNDDWKKLAHECLDNMSLFPEKSRQQFNYVIDWLHEWACTHKEGLGTRLPWDDKWIIESLSDSTIYMAYYTINHILKNVDAKDIDSNLFDFVFLGKDVPVKVDKSLALSMRKEFSYWYPLDFRNSGKDLIQNHLTFFIFNHTAIFEKKYWPKGIGVNGWVTVDGQKMSKSLGNVILIRDMTSTFGADASRFTILYGGEDMDDPNWDSELARSMTLKLEQFIMFAKENYGKGRSERISIDSWMESKLNETIRDATVFMEKTYFRSALQKIFFDLQKSVKWYMKRCNNIPNAVLMNSIIESQIVMMTPIIPHTCEEAWECIEKKAFVTNASWPSYESSKILETDSEENVRNIIDDISSVLKLAKIENPKTVKIIVSASWKYELYKMLKELLSTTRNPGEIISKVMATELKKYGQDITKIIPRIIKNGQVPDFSRQEIEKTSLMEAKEFLKDEFKAEVLVLMEENAKEEPKCRNAMPGKPAIVVE